MAITVKIAGIDRTEYINARSFSITDELTSRVNSASFNFICNNETIAPTAGETVLIEEGNIKLFSGRVLRKKESFFPPNLLKYEIECIDYTRDLDKKLVIESYLNKTAGYIIKDIIDKYTTGFTYTNVADGPTITKIAFSYIQVSEAITQIAEATGYEWYVDYNKDLYFFLKTDYPAPFQLDDNQTDYKDLVINYDISQLRNRVYVKSKKYETLDFTELFVGDGTTTTWTCKYQANATPSPSATLDNVVKTVGWDGVDNPDDYNFMLNATTKVLSLGTGEPTPANEAELVITYGADQAIIVRWDDQDSIDAIKAIEGGDGIFEYCITDNNIDTKEWAIDVAKADLLQNANPVIQGTFTTNKSNLRAGQLITLNSTKRNINQTFLIQKIKLIRILPVIAYPSISYKPAATATIGYKPAATATENYKSTTTGEMVYYTYQVTIATKLKGLEDLLLQLLYRSSESLKRDTTPPDVPTGLTLSTGMGKITQASLTWLKATWNANTEDDFSHYELKYKKTAYSDFGLVTTTDTSFIWTGLEQNIEYEVYIRSVDIYGNRSAWSSQVIQVTATDSETPAQVSGTVATALLSGIKVIWDISSETNIAGYAVERQESDDGTTWTGEWTERVRTDATMWLDLFLIYTKYYRYRVKAYTQAGVEGPASNPTEDGISPNKAGANDIVAGCITTNHLNVNEIVGNEAWFGKITTDHLKAGSISLATVASDFNWSTLEDDGGKPEDNADVTGNHTAKDIINLPDTPAGAGLYATGSYLGYYDSAAWKAYIQSNGLFYFKGDDNNYIQWNGSKLNVVGDIVIKGGSGIANLTDAGSLATKDEIANTDLGTTVISGGYLRTDLIKVKKVYVGSGTDEDIYFEDSGIRLYDSYTSGSYKISLYKDVNFFTFQRTSTTICQLFGLPVFQLVAGSQPFNLYDTGQLQLPNLSSRPTENLAEGQLCMSAGILHYYQNGAWHSLT